jgi:hypothetical protein
MWKRRRLSLYTTGFDISSHLSQKKIASVRDAVHSALRTSDLFSDSEAVFVETLLCHLVLQCSVVPVRVKGIQHCFSGLGIQKVFMIDDMWHCFELLCAAHIVEVPTYAIQHGHFTRYHVGIIPYADTFSGNIVQPSMLCVWSNYWKRELVRLGTYIPESSIRVVGTPTAPLPKVSRYIKKKPVGVLVPYETDAPKDAVRSYIEELQRHEDVRVFFKPRPDVPLEAQLRAYGLKEQTLTICTSLETCIETVQVAIGTYTSLLYELVASGVQVVLLLDVSDYGAGMVKNGIADGVMNVGELMAIIETPLTSDERDARRTRLVDMHDVQLMTNWIASEITHQE